MTPVGAPQTRLLPTGRPIAGEIMAGIARLYDEPEWLTSARREAFAVFERSASPSRVTHLWRYTDPAAFEPDGKNALPTPLAGPRAFPSVLAETLETESLAAGIYVRDGLVWKIAVEDEFIARGVRIMDLHQAAQEHPELVRQHLGKIVGPDSGRFEAYVNGAWTGGLLIHVPRGVEITKPVHVVTAQPSGEAQRAGRLLVLVESGASLTLIDEYGEGTEGGDAPVHTHTVVEMFLGAAARVKYAPVQNWNRQTTSYLTQRAHLEADARLETVLTAVGSQTAKVDCGAVLAGRGAQSNLFGLAIGDGRQHFDHHTAQHHSAGNTTSDLHFKVALRDRADSIYTGLIRIEDKAAYCEAYQENRNLILSPHAKVDTIPELEILNNEVRCTHAATVGKIDPQEVFYLESRGIDPAEAMRLIVTGFVGPILDHLPDVARERLRDAVVRRLEGEA